MIVAAALAVSAIAPSSASSSSKDKKSANPIVEISVSHDGQPLGKILIKLFPKEAPLSTANFVKLIKNKFYNGLTFHRIANLTEGESNNPGKIVQGGDPQGNGSGGPGWTIKGEFKENGVNNPLVHNEGAVAMARSQSNDSAGSQFYICVNSVHALDGKYAVFGQVIKGLDVAAKIQQGDKMTSVILK
jgi:cyclophilin family peptidyl-prolyl cis-trans isomerase